MIIKLNEYTVLWPMSFMKSAGSRVYRYPCLLSLINALCVIESKKDNDLYSKVLGTRIAIADRAAQISYLEQDDLKKHGIVYEEMYRKWVQKDGRQDLSY